MLLVRVLALEFSALRDDLLLVFNHLLEAAILLEVVEDDLSLVIQFLAVVFNQRVGRKIQLFIFADAERFDPSALVVKRSDVD